MPAVEESGDSVLCTKASSHSAGHRHWWVCNIQHFKTRDWEIRWFAQGYTESSHLTRKSKSLVKTGLPDHLSSRPIFYINVLIHLLYMHVPGVFKEITWVPTAAEETMHTLLFHNEVWNCHPWAQWEQRGACVHKRGKKSVKQRNCRSVVLGRVCKCTFNECVLW